MKAIGIPELIVIFIIVLPLFLLPAIFYLLTLQKALERCSPAARAMPPAQVWLMLIPLFNLVWHFLLVSAISKSLRSEFSRRNSPISDPEPGKTLGLAMCILAVVSIVPLLGFLTGIAGFICWIMYWVKISGYSSRLQEPFAVSTI